MAKKTKKINFEDSINELENIIRQLEAGDLSLEETLEKYESGLKYSTYCQEFLDKTEKKISILVQDDNGNIKSKPYVDK